MFLITIIASYCSSWIVSEILQETIHDILFHSLKKCGVWFSFENKLLFFFKKHDGWQYFVCIIKLLYFDTVLNFIGEWKIGGNWRVAVSMNADIMCFVIANIVLHKNRSIIFVIIILELSFVALIIHYWIW